MAQIAFIGLGNMGTPMAANLVRAGHQVRGFDISPAAVSKAEGDDIRPSESIAASVKGADLVITMLPAGPQVRAAYQGTDGIFDNLPKDALCIDCSTIDVDTARAVADAALAADIAMVDAPVSGGVVGAAAATLTFMVGGSEETFRRAEPYLASIGKAVIHAGPAGTGQAAKLCNNMILGISMIAVCEAFALARKLGLSDQKLFEISSQSSGQCWSLTSYCPVPGPLPSSPANRDYLPGFAVAMMLKDLKLAQAAAQSVDCATPLGAEAYQLYNLFAQNGNEGLDFSAIVNMIAPDRQRRRQ